MEIKVLPCPTRVKIRPLYILASYFLLCLFPYNGKAQTHEYIFNNNFNETTGGPALTERLTCGATSGGFGNQSVVVSPGTCINFNAFCFNQGGGFQYGNAGVIGGTYTINMYFKFTVGNGYRRLIDFSNGTSDLGLYVYNDCLVFYGGYCCNIGTCPGGYIGGWHLVTLVRDGATNTLSVYVDGVFQLAVPDSSLFLRPATTTSPIAFFTDNNCEDSEGCVSYISVSSAQATATDIALLYSNINTINQAVTYVPPSLVIAPAISTLDCINTSVTLTVSGASTYNWGAGVTTNTKTVNSANTYTVTATDANGCTATASSVVSQNITPPSATVTPTTFTLTCTNPNTVLTAGGGGTYNWGSGLTTSTKTVNSPATYAVTVTGANGCTASASSVVSQNITPPSASVSPSSGTLTCITSSIALTASGGGTYDWGGGNTTATKTVITPNTYTVTVTAANGCSASASSVIGQSITPPSASISPASATLTCSATTATLTASGTGTYNWGGGITTAANTVSLPGTYTVTVTAANSCTATASVVVSQNITPPVAGISPASSTLTCASPSTTLTASGGGTYNWGGAITTATNTVNAAATYTVTVTSANGCIATASAVVGQNFTPPSAAVTPATFTLNCTALSASLTASGGGTYNWGGGNTTSNNTVNTANTYTVTVTDVNGCTASASSVVSLDITSPTASVTPATFALTCANPSVTLTAAGPGTYNWGGGINTSTNTVNTASTYSVTVTAANGCTATASSVISQNLNAPALTVTPANATLTCSSASIMLTANGVGTYNWGGGITTATKTVNSPNTYTVTLTDANGCTASASSIISQNITPPVAAIAPANGTLTCATNSLVLTALGGGNYDWGGGNTTVANSVSTANTYTVTVTDAVNGCTATASSVVSSNTTPPVATIAPANATLTCTTLSNTLTASGGGNYDWGGGNTTTTNVVSSPNTYSVTVTGANGCTATASSVVSQNITPPVATVSPATFIITCAAPTATLTAGGGGSYDWGAGIITATNTVNSPNTYVVTVTAANGCTATASSVISQSVTVPPAAVSPTTATLTCSTLSATLTASGGTSYDWGGGITTTTNIVTSANTYTVTVTDGNGCTATASSMVSSNTTPPAAGVSPASAILTCATTAVTLTASGGGTYDWGGGNTTITNSVSTANAYTVTVTDVINGCTATASSVVSYNTAPPVAAIAPANSTLTCTTLSITITASGGATYDWGGGVITTTNSVTTPNTYSVTVTGANGCTATASSVVNQNITPPVAAVSPATTTINCTTPSATLIASGGTGYDWGAGITTATNSVNTPNTYSVTVTDANGCTATAASVVSQDIAAPNSGIAFQGILDCATLNFPLTASSSTANATFNWGGGNTTTTKNVITGGSYSVTVTDPANGCTAISSVNVLQNITAPNASVSVSGILSCVNASVTITASSATANVGYDWGAGNTTTTKTVSAAGNYAVTVSDPANSCTSTASQLVIQNITAPPVSIATPQDLNCVNATVTLTASSSVSGVTYDWGGGIATATNTVSVPASYPVTATDLANGCTATTSAIVIQNTTAPVAGISFPDTVNCHHLTVTLTATSSAATSSYNWGGGNIASTFNVSFAGSYPVTVTDNGNGCSATASTNVVSVPLMVLSETHTNISCFSFSDGGIDLTVSGGQTPFVYAWSNTAVTEDISGVNAGNYSVVVTDDIACTMSISVELTQPASMLVSETHSDVSCNGANDGIINVTTSAGTPVYTYRWNDNDTNEDRNSLAPNNYSVTVTDNNSCTASASAVITEPATLILQPIVTPPTCATLPNNGSVYVAASGGTTPLNFTWSTGNATDSITHLGEGNYSLTVTDAHACSVSSSYQLIYIYNFEVDASPFVIIDLGESTQLSYTLTGNTGNYSALWSPDYGLSCADCLNADVSPTYSTLYNITIQNDLGCVSTDTVTVRVVPKYDVFVPNVFTPNNDGNNELFQIFGNLSGLEYLQIQIFNRIGEKVFDSYDHQFKWDGTYQGVLQTPQIFTWQMKMTWLNGHKDEQRKGTLTLLK